MHAALLQPTHLFCLAVPQEGVATRLFGWDGSSAATVGTTRSARRPVSPIRKRQDSSRRAFDNRPAREPVDEAIAAAASRTLTGQEFPPPTQSENAHRWIVRRLQGIFRGMDQAQRERRAALPQQGTA